MSVTESQEQVAEDQDGSVGVQVPVSPEATPGGLKARVRARQHELAARTTELFAVPLYDAILAVELKAILWETTEEIARKNGNAGTNQVLYSACDELIAATVGFFEIQGPEQYEVVKDDDGNPVTSWRLIAAEIGDAKLPPQATARVALLSLCSDQGAMSLNTQFRQWLGGKDTGLGLARAEVRRDF